MLESGGMTPEAKYQELNKGENSGPNFLDLVSSRLRVFGGNSSIWAGKCVPFKEHEFTKKEFIPLSGWPISFNDLKNYYKEASKILGISFERFYRKTYSKETFHGISYKEFDRKDSFLSGFAIQTSSYENRNLGEKFKNKLKQSQNIEVLLQATVTKINLKEKGKISTVSVSDLDGNKSTINSKLFVLACGALENSRLLLSSNSLSKLGIGNNSNFVGKCFMSHPGINKVAEIFKFRSKGCISKTQFSNDYEYQFESNNYEIFKNKMLRHGLVISPYEGMSHFSTFYNGKILRETSKLLKHSSLQDMYRKRVCRLSGQYDYDVIDLGVAIEQPPLKENYITILEKKDALGLPIINVHWASLSEIERRTVFKSIEILAKELGATGVGRVKITKELIEGGSFKFNDPVNHHIGTTRMSNSSETGVVDKNCKVFGVSNLFIAGSSVFPTSSVVNPTFTIIALSIRLSDFLMATLRKNNKKL